MAEKRRLIFGAFVQDQEQVTLEKLKAWLLLFGVTALADGAFSEDTEMLAVVEGRSKKLVRVGEDINAFIGFMTRKDLERGILKIERNEKDIITHRRKYPQKVFLCIGTKEFCQAFVHFWTAQPKGVIHWGVHLIRLISVSENGDFVWLDSQRNHFWRRTMVSILADLAKLDGHS